MAVGIVCEFNPFHNGHRYLLARARKQTGQNIVCVMSGNFVQRGEPAAYDKELRARHAVLCGADLVLENPFPFSCATAERFAASAVKILAGSGLCDTLAFGCETGNEKLFFETAEYLVEKNTEKELRARVREQKNEGFARVRETAVKEALGEEHAALLKSPNSLLGIEYTCAILRQNVPLSLLPIARVGAAHDEKAASDGEFCSASYLREHPERETLLRFCPPETANDLPAPRAFSEEKFYAALRAKLLFSPVDALSELFDLPPDYCPKLLSAAKKYAAYSDFVSALRSKHLTDSRLRHMLLFALFSVTKDELSVLPDASLLLASSGEGRKMLKARDKNTFSVLPTLSHSKNASPRDRARLEKQTLAEKLCETLF